MAGDEDAFLRLYERLKLPIFRYVFYMTGSQASAEEVVQEVFISLLNNGDRYKPAQGDLAGFVFGIARNFIRRLKKRERLTEELPGDEALLRESLSRPEAEDLSAQLIRDQGVEGSGPPSHSYRTTIVRCSCSAIFASFRTRRPLRACNVPWARFARA
jgi:RNA polymerase sigma factor (sigma-70 family)